MNKKLFIRILIIILFLLPFIFNTYSIFRFLSIILAIILLSFSTSKKLYIKFIISLIFLAATFGLDTFLTFYLKRVPIFSIRIVSNDNFETYNSFFYRVYNCENSLEVDNFYKKDYKCNTNFKETDINSFLSSLEHNLKDYKNKFININGKVSSVVGKNSIEMQPFETSETSLNGEVIFSNNIKLSISSNEGLENLSDIRIYDTINVIGRIKGISYEGGVKVVKMVDSKIVSQSDFNEFDINIVSSKNCENDLKLLSKTEDLNYYTSCLDSIYVEYNEDNKYDLGYVLTDKRMRFELLNKDIKSVQNEKLELFTHENFNVIKCLDKKAAIVGNKTLNLDTKYCDMLSDSGELIKDEGV